MATLVEAKKTPITKDLFVKTLIKVWYELFEEFPKKESVGIILSQWELETGSGRSCYNYNLGNVKYMFKNGEEPGIKYHMLKGTWEILNGKKVIFEPPHPATWFLAFDSLEEGMAHHLKFLAGKRWKLAWSAVIEGNPSDFAVKLKEQRYYTAPVEDYKRLMNFYYKSYMSTQLYETKFDELSRECYALDPVLNNRILPAPIQMETLTEEDEVPTFKISFIDKIILFFVKLFKR
jgi:flagellum-specific peptidoglycan hydrolase FlgJ